MVVEHLTLAAVDIDPFDSAARIRGIPLATHEHAVFFVPVEAAPGIAHVAATIGSQRGAVRTAAEIGDHLDLPLRSDPSERAAGDLDEHDASIGHRDGALGVPGVQTRSLEWRCSYWIPSHQSTLHTVRDLESIRSPYRVRVSARIGDALCTSNAASSR